MKYVSWRILVVILWLVMVPDVQAQQVVGGQVVYTVFTDTGSAIALYDVVTGGERLLTDGLYPDGGPELSPAGDQVAFTSPREGDDSIHVINTDGSGLHRVSPDSSEDYNPTWSPDGLRIAYVVSQGRFTNTEAHLYIINADGTGNRHLDTGDGGGNSPDWSPDGTRIAFMSWRGGVDNHIFTVNIDGTTLRQLTFGDDHGLYPRWSPDGSKIAFRGQGEQFFFVNSDGSGSVQQITDVGDPGECAWADSQSILYEEGRLGGYSGIDYVRIDGTGHLELDIRLPQNGSSFNLTGLEVATDIAPAATLLPANGRLVFSMEQAGVAQLFTVNPDGTDLVQITSNPEGAYYPSWSPDGTRIAFSNRYGLVVMQADGTSSYMVSSGQFLGYSHWSPTRNELIAVGSYDLALVDLTLDTASVLSIADFTPGAFNQNPAWFPTGDALVFASTGTNPIQPALDGDPLMDLYTIGRDGVGVRKLDNINASYYGGLNWTSSDQIIFSARKIIEGQLVDGIFSYDLLTETLTLLSDPAEDAASPSVSPDETKIAFVQGQCTIMIMNIDGSHATTIATLNENVGDLDWQPVNTR